jgi:hypothetical protein
MPRRKHSRKATGKTQPHLNVTRLEELRADFARVNGKPFEHFYCPILLKDEPGELCDGHIVPEAFGKRTIPQRKDVDNFYGAAAEADFVGLMQDKATGVFANWYMLSAQRRTTRHREGFQVARHCFRPESGSSDDVRYARL